MHESCPYKEIELNSQYQILAARVNIGRQNAAPFANIYIPESTPIDLDELCRITNDLPKHLKKFQCARNRLGKDTPIVEEEL